MMTSCQTIEETDAMEDMWFYDDPRELTQRQNGKKYILDEYCGKIFFISFPCSVCHFALVVVVVQKLFVLN